jgi:plasmid stabilization system protein ParE
VSERFRVRWTRTAQEDLEAIVDYVASEDMRAAREILVALQEAAAKLEFHPDRGRYVPELRLMDVFTFRELISRPWRIVYRREESTVFVLAVLDGRRDLESLLIERLVR